MWLVVFGAIFVAIFVIFAVAEGIGAPSVPSGDAAIVEGGPSGTATVSEAEVKRGTAQQVAAVVSEGKSKAPKPGSKKFEELQSAAFGELIDRIWISGQAEEMNISATPKQLAEKLAEIKKQNFSAPNSYAEFLKKSHLTQEDVDKQVELQVFITEIQERVQAKSPPVDAAEIQAYYEENTASQFTTPASRDVRVIVNEDKAKVEAAKKALEADQSEANWKKVAPKYSSDPTTKTTGGLQKGITEEFVKGDLKKAIFDSATGELVGPVKYEKNYLLIEPVKLNPAKVKSLPEVKSQISQTLTQQKQEAFFSEFVSEYQSKWTARTFCGSGFDSNQRCSNFKGTGHPSTAAPACYEANPKAPAKECPAPVTMNTPAIPGSVSVTNPKGERLVQRPRPAGLGAPEGEGSSAVESVSPETGK
ncbi:MAG: peptidyl-prolyl cis-trans isomerase [Actinobacteria bacterium]|nr:peptidyl-prolyl cis-trans isomerase [Actinomycetota bacterium]